MKERVGIFGGTFDPPHKAHLKVARTACDHLGLDRLLWIPAGRPPHKEGAQLTDPHHRAEMARLMTDEDLRFRLELGEVLGEAISWTVDTLNRLHHAQPDWDLVLIMGEDQWATFDTWRQPEDIRRLAQVAVYRRKGTLTDDESDSDAALSSATPRPDFWLPGENLSEASTGIRKRLASGLSADDDLLPAVADYIKSHGLYS